MKLLVDVNLSPHWVDFLEREGWSTVHWSAVGDPHAEDSVILAWARSQGYLVFTHDLDFGTLLALTRAVGPSVLQIRTQDVTPESIGALVVDVLRKYAAQLDTGALIVVDEDKSRARILPIKQ